MGDPDDVRFEAVAAHMHHIRSLDLHLIPTSYTFTMPSRAYTAFNTTAPVLQFLSFSKHRDVGHDGRPLVHSNFGISEHTMPRLSSLQLHGIEMTTTLCQQIQSLRTFSFSFCDRSWYDDISLERSFSEHLRNLTTINVELAGWNASQGCPQLGSSVKHVNIRWTRRGLFIPRDTVPNQTAWNSMRAIRVTHMCRSSADLLAVTTPLTAFAIPGTIAPYQTLSLRTSGAPNTRVHARATDCEDRERVFCGLHPSTIAGMVANIPGQMLSTITITAAAVALRAFLDAECPVLSCIRLVLDTDDIAWIDSFARDMPNIKTLERLEFIRVGDSAAPNWTTATMIRVVSCCIGAGNKLREVLFLGFSPEAQCCALVDMFSQQVVINQDWREPKSDWAWFTEPPFEWQ